LFLGAAIFNGYRTWIKIYFPKSGADTQIAAELLNIED
jgi:hypothetical protein